MATLITLSQKDRGFFELVSQAAFSNPFSDTRTELDIKIADCSPSLPADKRIECVVANVIERVKSLEEKGKADINLYKKADRDILEKAFLFELFHIYSKKFDQLIADQIENADQPCPVPFAREALKRLGKRGFKSDDAQRLFAILYQIKRAYYFIDRGLIGESRSMKELRLHLWNNVFTNDIRIYERYLLNSMEDFSTLLLGETGTGKGAAAAAIGRSGSIPFDPQKNVFAESFSSNFITINLSLYPETLIESELFGHKKGAFTGAIEKHQGIFSRCSPHGSILLDEIGDVSPLVQVKLLQLLHERTFSPVGSHEKLRFNGRVIAATSRPLNELRKKGIFRNDFYYRLCSDCIVVPTLRQRLQENPHELDSMLNHVLKRLIGEESPELVTVVRNVIHSDVGSDYPWPGNVRELEQAVRRILLTKEYKGDSLPGQDLKELIVEGIDTGDLTAQELLSSYCNLLYKRFGTYEEIARRTNLDRRTVKKYIEFSQGKAG